MITNFNGSGKVKEGWFNNKRQKNYKHVYEDSSEPMTRAGYESKNIGHNSLIVPTQETSSFENINSKSIVKQSLNGITRQQTDDLHYQTEYHSRMALKT